MGKEHPEGSGIPDGHAKRLQNFRLVLTRELVNCHFEPDHEHEEQGSLVFYILTKHGESPRRSGR
jgi:hypothetical protein